MQINVSNIERVARVLIGIGLVYFGHNFANPWNWVTMILGTLLFSIGSFGFCAMYDLLKIKK